MAWLAPRPGHRQARDCHRLAPQGFRLFWTWKSRREKPGGPPMSREIRDLVRRMSRENTRRGAPRIHSELLKLGFSISQAAVSKYMVRYASPPSQAWRTFLHKSRRLPARSTVSWSPRPRSASCSGSSCSTTSAARSCIPVGRVPQRRPSRYRFRVGLAESTRPEENHDDRQRHDDAARAVGKEF